jgi:hypothetical protein
MVFNPTDKRGDRTGEQPNLRGGAIALREGAIAGIEIVRWLENDIGIP